MSWYEAAMTAYCGGLTLFGGLALLSWLTGKPGRHRERGQSRIARLWTRPKTVPRIGRHRLVAA